MDLEVEESIDFDFFDEHPKNTKDNFRPSPSSASASKPPLHPQTKSLFKTDNVLNNEKLNGNLERPATPARSDSSRDSSPEYSGDSASSIDNSRTTPDRHKGDVKTKRTNSESLSSSSSSLSSTSLLSTSETSNSHTKSGKSDMAKKRTSKSSSYLDSGDRPINPIAKSQKKVYSEKGKYQSRIDSDSSSLYTDSDDSKTAKSFKHCDDDGDFNEASGRMNKKEAWGEVKVIRKKKKNLKSKETLGQGRPKIAKENQNTTSYMSQNGSSCSYSDSDITDVSPIDSSRSDSWEKHKGPIEESSRITSAGDGRHLRKQFRPIDDDDHKGRVDNQEDDPDKITGLDLKLLMNAVGELEKQNRVQTHSRKVMFAPAMLKNIEKANYTFDRNQTRDIERENHRLLKEIVRQVNSEDKRIHYYRQPNSYRLTPSAVNRERDIQKIERENLALLKRLQEVKPTKSICRDHQLRTYENTVYLGVPIAELHHKHKGRHMHSHAIGDSDSVMGRARSVSSFTSVGSSVRSAGSNQSSSTSRQTASTTRRFDSRPAWSDRW